MTRSILTAVICLSLFASSLVAGDWRQFRGTRTSGLPDGPLAEWSGQQSLAWSVDLPGRGLSCPILVGDRVYLTASSGPRQDRLHVLCFRAENGDQLWERTFWATGRTACHPKTCVAAPSPASDGERIFAFYSSNDIACLDLDGNLLWYRGLTDDFPNASNSLGMSSSPVVAGETLIVMVESDAQAFAAGINVADGTTRWQIDRPRKANWSSPALWSDAQHVLLQSSAGVSAVKPQTGEIAWTYADGASTIPSLVVANDIAYVPSHGITALRPGQSNAQVPEIVWQVGNLQPGTASPIVVDDKLYVVNNAGVLTSASLETGQREWQSRFKGPFSSSPVLAGNKIVLVNEGGLVQVADPGNKGEQISSLELNETVLGTPAVGADAIFVRSDDHLWKIGLQ